MVNCAQAVRDFWVLFEEGEGLGRVKLHLNWEWVGHFRRDDDSSEIVGRRSDRRCDVGGRDGVPAGTGSGAYCRGGASE